jgi:D-alanine-D-alanine ligase
MTTQTTVLLLCGGRSDEHNVSLASARSVITALTDVAAKASDVPRVVPIVIDRTGQLYSAEASAKIVLADRDIDAHNILITADEAVTEHGLTSLETLVRELEVDVVFPLLHGPYGEDGSVQGLLQLLDLPYVGAGILASALGMDKLAMKAAFFAAGLPQVAYQAVTRFDWQLAPETVIERLSPLGYPLFVKPANLGSSVGISKVQDESALWDALGIAASFDRRIIVEEAVNARELEVGILGNDEPAVSPVGEILYDGEFYDYDTKYTPDKARLQIPAELDEATASQCRALALDVFTAVGAQGLARVDFFLNERGRLFVNEINTMPGFTQTSMYPKLWEAAGYNYRELIVELVRLAFDAYH